MSIIVSGQRSPSGRLLHRWIGDAPIYGGGNPHAGAIRRGLSGQALCLDRETRFTRFGTRRPGDDDDGGEWRTTPFVVPKTKDQAQGLTLPPPTECSSHGLFLFLFSRRPSEQEFPSQRILHPLRFPTISLSPLLQFWRAANGNFSANQQRMGPIQSTSLAGSTRKCKLPHFLTLELSIRCLPENCRGSRNFICICNYIYYVTCAHCIALEIIIYYCRSWCRLSGQGARELCKFLCVRVRGVWSLWQCFLLLLLLSEVALAV